MLVKDDSSKEPSQSLREKWLRRLFKIGVVVKGIDGVLETVGGAIFLCAARAAMSHFVTLITRSELLEDPDDWIANSLLHIFNHLSVSGKLFGGIYLLVHGVVKIFLVVSLLREKLWAFPTAMTVLLGFMVYQGYRLATHFSWLLVGLTALDGVILLLVWNEYRHLKQAMKKLE